MTAQVRIDRLTLRAGALSEPDARRLADLVALALGRLPDRALRPVAAATVDVRPETGANLEQLADAIAAQVADALWVEGAR